MKDTGNTTALGVLWVEPLITPRASEHEALYLQSLAGFAWDSCTEGHTHLGSRGTRGPITMGLKFSDTVSSHNIFPDNGGCLNMSRNGI